MVSTQMPEMAGLNPFDLIDGEAERIDRFYSALTGGEWAAPTRCAGWDRRALLAHLVSVEEYTRAGLDNAVKDLLTRSGATGYEDFNEWGVRQRDGMSPDELLALWQRECARNRAELRERGAEATMDTSVGQYPVLRQTCYLASELAIHADDAGVPEQPEERASRLDWRTRFAREAIAESGRDIAVTPVDGGELIQHDGAEYRVDDETFVAAASRRLPADHPLPPPVRDALVVLA